MRPLSLSALSIVVAVGLHPDVATAETVDRRPSEPESVITELLESGALTSRPNPVVLEYLVDAETASETLPEPVRRRAVDQLATALREQTLVSPFGDLAEMGSPMAMIGGAMKEGMKRRLQPENLLRRALGARSKPRDGNRAQERIRELLVDPWARGLAAARALARADHEDDAADFFGRCLAQPTLSAAGEGWGEWVLTSCRRGLIALGAETAGPVFADLAAEGQPALGIDLEAMAAMARRYGEETEVPEIEPIPEIRAQGLTGLAELFRDGDLSAAQRGGLSEAALSLLEDRQTEDIVKAAAARALGAARDRRGLKPLRRLARRDKLPEAQWAAREVLATSYRDGDAVGWLEKRLRRKPTGDDWRAFETLLALDRPSAWAWAEEQLGRRTVPMDEADWRTLIADRLGTTGDRRSVELLRRAERSDAQAENYQQALVELALFRQGERHRISALERVIEREDWDLGRRAIGQWWRLLKPLFKAAAMVAAGVPVGNEQQLIADFAFGALDRHRAQERREAATVDALRYKVASALAEWDDPRAVPLIERLLSVREPSTRLAAARALLGQTVPEAMPVLRYALGSDFGSEDGESRNPEIYAALLLHAAENFGDGPRFRELVADPGRFDDPSVRFLALALAPSTSPQSSSSPPPKSPSRAFTGSSSSESVVSPARFCCAVGASGTSL